MTAPVVFSYGRPRRFGHRVGTLAARLVPWLLLASLLAGLSGCSDPTAPRRPPYIAVVAIISAAPGTDVGSTYTYRVTELSGTYDVDETFRVSPRDTIIVPVQPATYRISLTGVPPQCQFRDGANLLVVVPENSNTAIVRYLISCESLITVTTATDGTSPDDGYIYRITGAGTERSGILSGSDTLWVDGLAPGEYDVELMHVAGHCVVTSDGGRHRRFTVAAVGGQKADFRIVCSDEQKRPRLVSFGSSYHDGTSGFVFRATDPDRDIERYYWDITDCQGKSILPDGGRLRRGLSQDRTAGQDTVLVFGAIEIGLPASELAGRCTSIRVADEYGNSTPVVEEAIGNETGSGPIPVAFNAKFSTTAALTANLQMADPDYAGVFLAALLRDGILFAPDGKPDLGVYNTVGYPDVLLPTVPLGGGRPQYYDYYAVIAYLFDGDGNFTRVEDDDLFQ